MDSCLKVKLYLTLALCAVPDDVDNFLRKTAGTTVMSTPCSSEFIVLFGPVDLHVSTEFGVCGPRRPSSWRSRYIPGRSSCTQRKSDAPRCDAMRWRTAPRVVIQLAGVTSQGFATLPGRIATSIIYFHMSLNEAPRVNTVNFQALECLIRS